MVLGNLALCVGGACFQCFCSCFKSCCGATMKQQVRLSYVLLTGFFILLSLLILWYIAPVFTWFEYLIECPKASGGSSYCLGVSAVYRMSIALTIFYLMMLLIMTFKNQISREWNEGVWFPKIVIIFIIFLGLFFVPNNIIIQYSKIAQYFGIIFILFQIVMWVDLFYSWGEKWIHYYDSSQSMGESCWKYSIIITTFILYGSTLYILISSFTWFGGDGCSQNLTKIIITIIIIISITILTILRFAENASLLTSGAASLFISYLMWSALSSDPQTQCNTLSTKKLTLIIEQTIGFLVLVISLIYVTITSSDSTSGTLQIGNTNIAAGLVDKEPQNDGEGHTKEQENDIEQQNTNTKEKKSTEQKLIQPLDNQQQVEGLDSYQSNYHMYFHLIMILSSIYIQLLLTNWGNVTPLDKELPKTTSAETAHWVKLSYLWTYSLLFIWTLIAPKICPSRQFADN